MDGLDLIARILWYAMFVAPLITLWWAWRWKVLHWVWRIVFGLLLGFAWAACLGGLSIAILFRDGMGP